ncbi:hypothetical protein [Dehalobacter sp. TeCB1]|jgi:hypothetical protein|uniref:hypothetical protein n=1 Tax=Dehalobacter sp. TeCB1 TaxID=1843715 RepID=UPI00083A014D|nr:hypothetical protein [Dehalobacter sp. TeCB1]OCZ49743.1 hypothetical protein A7D23_02625 [Dehalobacter sp. TeCB1]
MIDSYILRKFYFLYHSVNESSPEIIDRTNNNCFIVLVDDVLMDVEFDDVAREVIYHQKFRLVNEDGKIEVISIF